MYIVSLTCIFLPPRYYILFTALLLYHIMHYIYNTYQHVPCRLLFILVTHTSPSVVNKYLSAISIIIFKNGK